MMSAVCVLPFSALAIITVLGQQIGGAMSTVTPGGRSDEHEMVPLRGETGAAVAVRFQRHAARMMAGRPVAGEARCCPSRTDPHGGRSRTAGLVTLPGVFVGMILGCAAPLDTGLIQP